jgi:hypothetical protein
VLYRAPQVLEAREAVEETDDPAELQTMLEENQRLQAGVIQRISDAFHKGQPHSAASAAMQLTYLVRLEEGIIEKL